MSYIPSKPYPVSVNGVTPLPAVAKKATLFNESELAEGMAC